MRHNSRVYSETFVCCVIMHRARSVVNVSLLIIITCILSLESLDVGWKVRNRIVIDISNEIYHFLRACFKLQSTDRGIYLVCKAARGLDAYLRRIVGGT